jgi:hypothetical protein
MSSVVFSPDVAVSSGVKSPPSVGRYRVDLRDRFFRWLYVGTSAVTRVFGFTRNRQRCPRRDRRDYLQFTPRKPTTFLHHKHDWCPVPCILLPPRLNPSNHRLVDMFRSITLYNRRTVRLRTQRRLLLVNKDPLGTPQSPGLPSSVARTIGSRRVSKGSDGERRTSRKLRSPRRRVGQTTEREIVAHL